MPNFVLLTTSLLFQIVRFFFRPHPPLHISALSQQLNFSFHPYSEVCQRIFVGCGHLQLAFVTVALLHVGAGGAGGAVDAGTLTPGDALPVQ